MSREKLTDNRKEPGAPWVWSLLFSGSLFVLVAAWVLEPASKGFGTHTQLGLPPCGFRWMTGLPCPGCGLTTGFAYFVRGNWLESLRANPLSFPLALTAVFGLLVGPVGIIRKWNVHTAIRRFAPEKWFALLGLAALLNWLIRVIS